MKGYQRYYKDRDKDKRIVNNRYESLKEKRNRKIIMVLKSLLVGFLASGIIILYRLTLTYAEQYSAKFYNFIRSNLKFLPLLIVALGLLAFLVGHLLKKDKLISGSGIPQIEGIMKGHFRHRKPWYSTLIRKFLGGALAIFGGLSLGREGPSIQLGANVAEGIGNKLAASEQEKKVLMASGASAGLAAAFNAPMAGVVFALEEIFKYFSPIILLSMMSAAVAADFLSKQVFGLTPIFQFTSTQALPLSSYWLLLLLGLMLGVMGAGYNATLLKTKQLYSKLDHLHPAIKMIIPFAIAGLLGLLFPVVMGSGHHMVEELNLGNGLGFLCFLFLIKFFFSMISFGSGAPGGIFFPLIILGASLGAIFASFFITYLGMDASLFYPLIMLAMAGYFTAIVRAPITGIVLIIEMTGSFTHILPLTLVSMLAYVVADLLKSPPIYDALLDTMVGHPTKPAQAENNQKIVLELLVKQGSPLANHVVKDISWPGTTLLVGIRHGEQQLIPKGDTKIQEGDYVTILVDTNNETWVKEALDAMNDSDLEKQEQQ
jgi:H+/Cl- antiporter ClcA